MNESLHNNDDELFRKAYGNYEEEPSPDVWEKLNAKLDQKDGVFYRRKSRVWKRSAAALLLLLLLFGSYELGIKTKNNFRNKRADDSVNQSLTKKVHPLENSGLSQPLPPHQTDSDVVLQMHDEKRDVHISQSASGENKSQVKRANQNHTIDVSKSGINQTIPTKRLGVTARKGRSTSDSDSLLTNNNFYNKKQSPANDQNASKDTDDIVNSRLNKKAQRNEPVNNDSSTLVKEENNDANTLLADSSNESTSLLLNQTTTDKNNSSVIQENTADSNASASTVNAKKQTVRLNKMFKPHWSFSPYVSADFSGHLLNDNDHFRDPNGRDNRHHIEEREKEQVGYSFGVISRYQFSKSWLIKTGLGISNQSTHIDPQTLYALPTNQNAKFKYVTSSGYAYINPSFSRSVDVGDSIVSEMAEQHLSYLSMPIQLSYIIHAGKSLSVLPGVGFTTNIFLGSKMSTEVHGHEENEKSEVLVRHLQGLDHINFSFIADAELQYQLGKKWSIMLLPSFKYAVDPITKEHVVKTYPYNIGLGFGVTYGL